MAYFRGSRISYRFGLSQLLDLSSPALDSTYTTNLHSQETRTVSQPEMIQLVQPSITDQNSVSVPPSSGYNAPPPLQETPQTPVSNPVQLSPLTPQIDPIPAPTPAPTPAPILHRDPNPAIISSTIDVNSSPAELPVIDGATEQTTQSESVQDIGPQMQPSESLDSVGTASGNNADQDSNQIQSSNANQVQDSIPNVQAVVGTEPSAIGPQGLASDVNVEQPVGPIVQSGSSQMQDVQSTHTDLGSNTVGSQEPPANVAQDTHTTPIEQKDQAPTEQKEHIPSELLPPTKQEQSELTTAVQPEQLKPNETADAFSGDKQNATSKSDFDLQFYNITADTPDDTNNGPEEIDSKDSLDAPVPQESAAQPASSTNNTTVKPTTTESKKSEPFRGVIRSHDGFVDKVNVTKLSFMLFRIMKQYKLLSLLDFPCKSNLNWMPEMVARMDYEMPGFLYTCGVRSTDEVPLVKKAFAEFTEPDIYINDLSNNNEDFPKSDGILSWNGIQEWHLSDSWRMIKKARLASKILMLSTNPGFKNLQLIAIHGGVAQGKVDLRKQPILLDTPDKIVKNLTSMVINPTCLVIYNTTTMKRLYGGSF
mmetsp:Transcript_10616/g.19147  ORF Transcript_10616/g.19147 Transcript_10616/m.19147 type:complete len:593 (-) Transcript_10616:63-1841(-)